MSDPRWSLDGVPERPGVYIFRDAAGAALYIGKAANLRARLASYRRPGGDGRLLIRFLEQQAARVETIVTRTESEALLLEDELVKRDQPPHNIRLKDDKSFLMVRIDLDERFPRLKLVREHSPHAGKRVAKAPGRSRLFGPYASTRALREMLSDLHRVVPLRDCTDSVMNHRTRPCLKHQIGLCAAPCTGLIDAGGYQLLIERAVRVLEGDIDELVGEFESRMRAASAELAYERAAQWRDRLAALRQASERQGVKTRESVDRDVFALARRADRAVVHRLAFRAGRMTESRAHTFKSELPDEELLHVMLSAIYAPGRAQPPRELVLPCRPAEHELLARALGAGVELVVPTSGERLRMLALAGENARSELERTSAADAAEGEALAQLAALLGFDAREPDEPPLMLDCFDISTFQGKETVAARVRFRGGIPDRAGYRRYQVKTVAGQDDFAALREVVTRALRRGLAEEDLPDLIVIDGGAQQLASALTARDEVGAWDVRMVGLAKARAERNVRGKRKEHSEERVVLDPDQPPLELARHTTLRHLFERLRDEAHRFAITYHRKQRGKLESRLDAIPGVGEAKRKTLLRAFGSLHGVKEASVEQLAALPGIGMELAKVIVEHLQRPAPRA
ncbi:MAG: excinuclease ABC subunit UvrC [Planctomycetes bacterium]|nr:excinuclease ABC subunit UvrC [Planctomycetota bacterium]